MSGKNAAHCDPFLVDDTHSADPTSPIAYVRGVLKCRLRIGLVDSVRRVVGDFVALDGTGTLLVRNAIECVDGNEREFDVVLIPLVHVQRMEVAE
jgi:hypothetical protein